MLRSTCCTPNSSTTRVTAAPTTAGSTPYSCRLLISSSGWKLTIPAVLAPPSTSPRADTISHT
jgi:hypothetical protein